MIYAAWSISVVAAYAIGYLHAARRRKQANEMRVSPLCGVMGLSELN